MTAQEALKYLGFKTGVPDIRVIKKRYKELARKYHPDTCKSTTQAEQDKCTAIFLKVQEAYEVLEKTDLQSLAKTMASNVTVNQKTQVTQTKQKATTQTTQKATTQTTRTATQTPPVEPNTFSRTKWKGKSGIVHKTLFEFNKIIYNK